MNVMKKPFWKTPVKDWGVVNFLQEKGADIGGDLVQNITDVVLRGESPVKAVADVIRGDGGKKLTQEDMAKAMELASSLERQLEHEEKMQELENADRENARAMEKVRLQSGSAFIKRFTYILAILLIAGAFVMLGIITFTEIPEGNKTLFNVAFGYIWGSFSTVIAYYFGDNEKGKST